MEPLQAANTNVYIELATIPFTLLTILPAAIAVSYFILKKMGYYKSYGKVLFSPAPKTMQTHGKIIMSPPEISFLTHKKSASNYCCRSNIKTISSQRKKSSQKRTCYRIGL